MNQRIAEFAVFVVLEKMQSLILYIEISSVVVHYPSYTYYRLISSSSSSRVVVKQCEISFKILKAERNIQFHFHISGLRYILNHIYIHNNKDLLM